MRVFLSWSGERSERVAIILKEWLPTVVQALDTWVSSSDIEKGEAWFASISTSLVEADGVGIFCLTPENLGAQWLAYEAGVLASRDRARVATFRFGVEPQDVKPPLGLFQSTSSTSKDDVLRLVRTLNSRLPTPLAEQRLEKAFAANWDSLAEQLSAIGTHKPAMKKAEEPTVQLLNEILAVVRRIEKDQGGRGGPDAAFWGKPGEGLLSAAAYLEAANKVSDPAAPETITKNALVKLLEGQAKAKWKAVPPPSPRTGDGVNEK